MINRKILSFFALLCIFAVLAFHKAHQPEKSKGFALIELHTSEGCSSCPPADKLIAKMQQQYQDKDVYVLAYHVDYWNRLGWKDVFSNAAYSARQRAYAGYLKTDGVYTPQAIVNGRTEFIGSEDAKMQNAVRQYLNAPATADLQLGKVSINGNKAMLTYQTSAKGANLMLAVVQKHAQTIVKAGENNGHTLSHINIVRSLQSIGIKGHQGTASISLPAGFNSKEWFIMAFLQDKTNGAVLAAQQAKPDHEG